MTSALVYVQFDHREIVCLTLVIHFVSLTIFQLSHSSVPSEQLVMSTDSEGSASSPTFLPAHQVSRASGWRFGIYGSRRRSTRVFLSISVYIVIFTLLNVAAIFNTAPGIYCWISVEIMTIITSLSVVWPLEVRYSLLVEPPSIDHNITTNTNHG